ncbi:MAG: hypothetical protein IH899_11725 [Planctomycetes bacterium]|nr:hypothetical protein [Planctomycetota bacterium]
MKIFHFRLILAGLPEMTEEAANALFEAGCDDCLPGSCDGVSMCQFHREATSLEDAIGTAVADVSKAGYEVQRVEIEDDDLTEFVNSTSEANA